MVAGAVEDARVVARKDERCVPVKAITRLAAWRLRAHPDYFAGAQVAAHDRSVLALGVDDVGVVRINAADETIAAADQDPVLVEDPVRQRATRPTPRAIVLQSAVDAVRLPRVN